MNKVMIIEENLSEKSEYELKKDEIYSSLERYIKNVMHENGEISIYGTFENFWKDFLKGNTTMVIFVGYGNSFEKDIEDGYFKDFEYLYKIFSDVFGYVSVPFNPLFLKCVKGFNSGIIKEIEKFYEDIKKDAISDEISKEWSSFQSFIKNAGNYFGLTTEEITETSHGEEENQGLRRMKIQIANLIAGVIKIKIKGEKIKILWIDNKPEKTFKKIDERFKFKNSNFCIEDLFGKLSDYDIETYIYDGEIDSFEKFIIDLKKIKEEKNPQINIYCRKPGNSKDNQVKVNLVDFNLFLVDLYLGKNKPTGIEILHNLTEIFPHIPSFVLSVSDDFLLINKSIGSGADYYIIKNQSFSIPYAYLKYLDEIGKILNFFENKEYQRNLLGNIRYWKFKKGLLWFGDKCYHMIDHGFIHTKNDWENLNNILLCLIEEKGKKEIFGDDELLYSFCMGIWLHDVGHKGSDVFGEPYKIRDNHGYIAGELILRYPGIFRILEIDDYYNHNKIDYSQTQILEMMLKREKKGLTIPEIISLFAIYHKSNAPVDWDEAKNLHWKKLIPLEYYEGKKLSIEKIITCEKILEKRKFNNPEKFLRLLSLFRFVDSIDIINLRVGDITERELKEMVIENDASFQFSKLKKEVIQLSNKYTSNPVESAIFVKNFYQDVREAIERGEFTQLSLPEEIIKDIDTLENYRTLVDYSAYINLQKTHFNLHLSIKNMNFQYKGNKNLKIILSTDMDEEFLKNNFVRERGKNPQSIYERIIGKENYVFKESENVKKYLKEFFEEIELILKHEQGKFESYQKWRL